ncbi:hypothetical protein PN36_12345 [Candidatus Thiomargarita nelsonii]|uniref:Helix-turn-helix domain-containing protein n=1 Tax=Candidatus Thiomargarita nelsonii TaxID=1003181 RepID=A0A0A6PEM7_9GAMM|nr:hypothetical protein PN36_12345 [Candidatus Thiomargarita nelsonii]
MEKLSIREASERFGLSRARLYKLLNQGALVGHISPKKDGKSWIYPYSLQDYYNGNKGLPGRPQVESEGGYVSVREACQKTGYTDARIYQLIKQGNVASKKGKKGGVLVFISDLLKKKK